MKWKAIVCSQTTAGLFWYVECAVNEKTSDDHCSYIYISIDTKYMTNSLMDHILQDVVSSAKEDEDDPLESIDDLSITMFAFIPLDLDLSRYSNYNIEFISNGNGNQVFNKLMQFHYDDYI